MEDPPTEPVPDDVEVRKYLLPGLPSDKSFAPGTTPTGVASKDARFNAMLSPVHLMAAVLAQNRTFGATAFDTRPYVHVELTSIVSNGMAVLLDEQYIFLSSTIPIAFEDLISSLELVSTGIDSMYLWSLR